MASPKASAISERRALAAAYAAHPERFVGGVPRPASLPTAVWINPPPQTGRQDGPGTTIATPGNLRVHTLSSAPVSISIQEVAL
jgi:hypothetical protein